MTKIFGVDFSGGRDAGRKIWMTSAHLADNQLIIDDVRRAVDFTDGGRPRDTALSALRSFIASQNDAVFGLDFAFGLPQPLVKQSTWVDFAKAFADDYPTVDAFYNGCRGKSAGKELKRQTDIEELTPFSPYNLRMFRQTYYGIHDVLAPLVRDDSARILPMQAPHPDKPVVLEICPASTLRNLKQYNASYKGRTPTHRKMREDIMAYLKQQYRVTISDAQEILLIADNEGDALDSFIGACTTADYVFKKLKVPNDALYQIEGFVYTTAIQ